MRSFCADLPKFERHMMTAQFEPVFQIGSMSGMASKPSVEMNLIAIQIFCEIDRVFQQCSAMSFGSKFFSSNQVVDVKNFSPSKHCENAPTNTRRYFFTFVNRVDFVSFFGLVLDLCHKFFFVVQIWTQFFKGLKAFFKINCTSHRLNLHLNPFGGSFGISITDLNNVRTTPQPIEIKGSGKVIERPGRGVQMVDPGGVEPPSEKFSAAGLHAYFVFWVAC